MIYFFPFFKPTPTWMVSYLICPLLTQTILARCFVSVLPRVQVPELLISLTPCILTMSLSNLLSELVAHLVPKRFVPMRNQLFIMKECLRFVIATGFCLCTPYRIVLACSGVNLCGE